jgi:hypothetical protein
VENLGRWYDSSNPVPTKRRSRTCSTVLALVAVARLVASRGLAQERLLLVPDHALVP